MATYNDRLHAAARPRGRLVIRLRKAGKTWAAIGERLGISRQRAHALAKAHSRNGK